MITLRSQLEEYKQTVLDLIEKVRRDGEVSDVLLEKKNFILKEIKEADYNKEEIKNTIEELSILSLENELELEIKKEMVKIKKKIENMKTSELMRENYRNLQRQKIVLFRGRA